MMSDKRVFPPFEIGNEVFKGRESLDKLFERLGNAALYEVQDPHSPWSTIFEIIGRPDVYGRRLNLDLKNASTIEDIRRPIAHSEALLKKYIPDYTINHTIVFTGTREADLKSVEGWAISEKVEAVSPEGQYWQTYIDQFNTIITRACVMFRETYDPESKFGQSIDLQFNNFIFGTTTSQPDPRLHFVDIYPATTSMNKEKILRKIDLLLKNLPQPLAIQAIEQLKQLP